MEFDSEFVWNYELGLKGGFWDNRLQAQLAAFFIDWDGQIINQHYARPSGGGGAFYRTNAGSSRITGFEALLQWYPVERLSLTTSVALMDTELVEFEDPATAPIFGLDPDFSGNELPFAPEVSGSVSGQYLVPLGREGWEARLRADTRYMGERFLDATNLMRADGYWLTNMYAGVQKEHYEVGLFINNVFDEEYLVSGALPNDVFPPLLTVGDPRTYGIRANVRF